MTQHTSGPWKYVGHSGTFFITQTADGSDDAHHSFAKCYPATYHPTGWEACKNESEANARLIAAAPMLLEALKLMLESHDATCAGPECGITGVDMARAALRAAKGESNG